MALACMPEAVSAQAGGGASLKADEAQSRLVADNAGIGTQLSSFAQQFLAIHNEERASVGARPLRWNMQLEVEATSYAHTLAQIRELVHAPRQGQSVERENLLKAQTGWSPERMMQDWTIQKSDFVPGNYPNVALDGDPLHVSNYTLMIWPTTADIGCGSAEGGGFEWVVCRYSPGGNRDGKPVGMPTISPGA